MKPDGHLLRRDIPRWLGLADGTSLQIATVTGDASSGYVATLQVGIAA